MKIFKRGKRNNPEENRVPDKKLESFNYTPVSYSFSGNFKSIIDNMESWSKRKIDKIPINELSDDICDPEVDALCQLETAISCGENTNHIRVIKEIIDSCTSEIVRAQEIKKRLIEDREEHKTQRDEYLKLQKSLRATYTEG